MITSVGKFLIARRRALGLCLDDVAHASRVSRQNLRWLEADELDRFPNLAYALAFLRFYAGVLELDAEALLTRARAQFAEMSERSAGVNAGGGAGRRWRDCLLGGPGAAWTAGRAKGGRARAWERAGTVLSAAALSIILAAAGLTVMAHLSPAKAGPAATATSAAAPAPVLLSEGALVAESTRRAAWPR